MNKDENNKEEKTIVENNSFLFEFFLILFKPSTYVNDLSEVNFKLLKEQGTKLVICDLDNTLVPHFTKFPTSYAKSIVEAIKNAGLEIILISNNTENRVSSFAKLLGVEYIYNAKKPFTRKIKNRIKETKYESSEILVIGDMIVMDILAANRLEYQSILVRPIISYNNEVSRVINWFEKNIFKRLQRNNILINEGDDKLLIYDKKYEII